jgi:hypothetical protein
VKALIVAAGVLLALAYVVHVVSSVVAPVHF